jgi:iron complex transport system substrate-binding protein
LDQCADQYVLALSPRAAIVGLSPRADDADSRLRAQAAGLPKRRATLEAALAARPDVVLRTWGGDPRLLAALRARGVQVVSLDGAPDFAGIRADIRAAAFALQQPAAGEALIAGMNAKLAASIGAWGGTRAVYLTPGGATAGPGTLPDAILVAAGMTNAETRPGFRLITLERLAARPPRAVVFGFFDTFQLTGDHWGVGRHRVLRRLMDERAVARLPGELLGCADWSAAEAVARLASEAPR